MTRRFHMDLSCESKYALLFGDDISCTEKAVESKTECMGAMGKNRVNALRFCSFDVTKASAQAFRCPPKKITHNLKLKVRKNSCPQKINGQPSELSHLWPCTLKVLF